MKKLVLVLLVAMLSVPAFAANPTISLQAGAGLGEVDVMYNSDGDANNLPSGIGLIVSADSTATITQIKNYKQGVSTSSSKGYGIFPGQLVVNGTTLDPNTPVVGGDDNAGVTANNDNSIELELGALYKRSIVADAPLASGRLCTIVVDKNCTVTVTGDAASCGTGKGIIAQNYAAYGVDADNSVTFGVTVALPAPTVTGITPSTGVYGTTVTISNLAGTNFVSGATAKLVRGGYSDIPVTVAFDSATKLTGSVVLPYLAIAGNWDVVVTNPDAQFATKAAAFVVTAPAAPAVTSIVPLGGAAGFTTSVADLKGTNFGAGATVKLTKSGSSDIAATNVVVASATKITCDLAIPAGAAAGTWNVVVTNTDARIATKANAFTVGDCMKNTAPVAEYNAWVSWNKPSCWCYSRHCRGDGNGTKQGLYWVGSLDLDAFRLALNKNDTDLRNVPNGVCSDFNHSKQGLYRVGSLDLDVFRIYFNQAEANVTVCTTVAFYNFWTN